MPIKFKTRRDRNLNTLKCFGSVSVSILKMENWGDVGKMNQVGQREVIGYFG